MNAPFQSKHYTHYEKISGEDAIKFKRNLLNQAVGFASRDNGKNVITVKYPVETQGLPLPDHESVIATNNVIRGKGEGSLFHFLMSLHLSGFELYSKFDAVKLAYNSKLLKKHYPLKLINANGEIIESAFDMHAFFETIGRQTTPDLDKFVRTYYNVFAIDDKLSDKSDPVFPELKRAVIHALSSYMSTGDNDQGVSFRANIADLIGAFQGFLDEQAEAVGSKEYKAPSLISVFKKMEPGPQNTTVMYRKGSPFVALSDDPSQSLYNVVALISKREGLDDADLPIKAKAAMLQERIVTSRGDGLSWLFNEGLNIFRDLSVIKETFADITDEAAAQVHSAAKAIPKSSIFSKTNYADYRTVVQGDLDSWLSNSLKRLEELQIALASGISVPEKLADEKAQGIFQGTPLTYATAVKLCERVSSTHAAAVGQIQAIMGMSDNAVNIIPSVIADYRDDLNTAIKMLRQIRNNCASDLRLAKKAGNEDHIAYLTDLLDSFDIPEEANSLVMVGGGIPSEAERDNQLALDRLNAIVSMRNAILENNQLLADEMGAIKLMAEKIKADYKKQGDDKSDLFAIREAKRLMLRAVFSTIRYFGGERTRKLALSSVKGYNLFARQRRDLNMYFNERKGDIYVSVYSRGKHQAYAFNDQVLDTLSIGDMTARILDSLKTLNNIEAREYKDIYSLEDAFCILQAKSMVAFNETCNLGVTTEEMIAQGVEVPLPIRVMVQENAVTVQGLARIMQLLSSAAFGCLNQILRPNYVINVPFQRKDVDVMYYGTKPDATYQMPERLYKSDSSLASQLKALGFNNEEAKPVAAQLLSENNPVRKKIEVAKSGINLALNALPHNYYLSLDFASTEDLVAENKGQAFIKLSNMTLGKSVPTIHNPARLVGSSSMRKWFDRLLHQGDVKMGQYDLQFELLFRNTTTFDGYLIKDVSTEFVDPGLHLSVPMTTEEYDPQQMGFGDNIVAIDLNENNIGFCASKLIFNDVGDIERMDVIQAGVIDVPEIKALIEHVNNMRGRFQQKQTFRQRSNNLEKTREAAIGKVRHLILSLMHQYNAFPIFETQLKNFETGAAQIKLIYGSLIEEFCYSDVAAHKAHRASVWLGANMWKHPSIEIDDISDDADQNNKSASKKTKKVKRKTLNLFPGTSVNAFGTSQTCSCCGVNSFSLVKDTLADRASVITDKNGVVIIDGVELEIKTTDKATVLRNRKRRMNTILDQPLPNKAFTKPEILSQLKRQVRQKHKSQQVKDSSQAVFYCPVKGCNTSMSADKNAAINIAQRFIEKLLRLNAKLA